MRHALLTAIVILWATVAYAGGGNFDQEQEQMSAPQSKVVVVNPPSDNTAIYVGAAATVLAAGIGYLGVRHQRKK
jgi:hypothetical protein